MAYSAIFNFFCNLAAKRDTFVAACQSAVTTASKPPEPLQPSCTGDCVISHGGAEFMVESCNCTGGCRPSDSYHGRQHRHTCAEFRVVGEAIDIRFATLDDAVYALQHLLKISKSTGFSIAN